MKKIAVYAVGAVVAYTVLASIWNRFYIAGYVANPLPNKLGNLLGQR